MISYINIIPQSPGLMTPTRTTIKLINRTTMTTIHPGRIISDEAVEIIVMEMETTTTTITTIIANAQAIRLIMRKTKPLGAREVILVVAGSNQMTHVQCTLMATTHGENAS